MGNAMAKKDLPEELVAEILLNLPVKSLLRFRCVSKSWYNLITSPNFIKLHLNKIQNHDYILIVHLLSDLTKIRLSYRDYESLGVIAPQFEVPLANILIMNRDFESPSVRNLCDCDPCHGLICISNHATNIVLCNPSLREFKELHPPYCKCPKEYEPTIYSIGLGFDSNKNDYKVVSFVYYESKLNPFLSEVKCQIYDVGIDTWRETDHQQELDMSSIQPYTRGVLYNGALHWMAIGTHISSNELTDFILCFDVNTEVFRKIPFPIDKDSCQSLIVFDNSLALLSYKYRELWEQNFVEIWVMKEHKVDVSWTKQYTVGPMIGIRTPFLVRKNKTLLLEGSRRQMVSRGFDTDEIHAYGIYGHQNILRVLVNQESLVSFK